MTAAPQSPPAAGDPPSAPAGGPLTICVHGKPITQGSKTRNRFGGVRDDNATTLKPWRDNVRSAALDALAGATYWFGGGPVTVAVTFRFARPAGHYGTGRNAHLLRDSAPAYPTGSRSSGDIDKLQRACLDALTDAAVWRDDAQVVDVVAHKRWADDANPPGADIYVRRAVP